MTSTWSRTHGRQPVGAGGRGRTVNVAEEVRGLGGGVAAVTEAVEGAEAVETVVMLDRWVRVAVAR